MDTPRRTDLSETELEILKTLWEMGAATVRELHERRAGEGRQWAYTTVLTFLTRLEAKGYVVSERSGLAHVFRPLVSRDNLLRQKLVSLARELCDGTASPLVRALVEGQRFSIEEITQFRQLLDDLEPSTAADEKRRRRKKNEDRD